MTLRLVAKWNGKEFNLDVTVRLLWGGVWVENEVRRWRKAPPPSFDILCLRCCVVRFTTCKHAASAP